MRERISMRGREVDDRGLQGGEGRAAEAGQQQGGAGQTGVGREREARSAPSR